MCDGPACAVSRTLRCFRLGRLSGYLRHCQRDHLPLHQSLPQTIPFGRLSYQKDCEIRNLSSALRTGDRSQAICCVPMKPGIGSTASSYSPLRRRGILSAPPSVSPAQPRHTCSRPRVQVGYCYSPLQLDDYTVVI